ncbi:hypothetical protein, partial [Photobacterium sp. OFAV2-7]|uniref:hypothetical protein n=1 Tax=Photobacterium sp. OFAV2-7 TaxID=2917748 RepID=UPI001EF5960D
GYLSTAWGYSTIASGDNSTVFGALIKVSGNSSVGIGLSDLYYGVDESRYADVSDDHTFAVMGGKMQLCNDDNVCIDNVQQAIVDLQAQATEISELKIALNDLKKQLDLIASQR